MELVRPRSLVRERSEWGVELECPACARALFERFDVDTRFADCACGARLEIDALSLFSSGQMPCAAIRDADA